MQRNSLADNYTGGCFAVALRIEAPTSIPLTFVYVKSGLPRPFVWGNANIQIDQENGPATEAVWRDREQGAEPMIAAIVFTGFMGLAVMVWRRNIFTIGVGLALLVTCALLLWDHLEWLRD